MFDNVCGHIFWATQEELDDESRRVDRCSHRVAEGRCVQAYSDGWFEMRCEHVFPANARVFENGRWCPRMASRLASEW